MKKALTPFFHAGQFTAANLFWAPVPGFPMPERYTTWYSTFFERLMKGLAGQNLQIELFMHHRMAVEEPMARVVRKHQRTDCPITGLGRRPGAKLQTATAADIDGVQKGAKAFRLDDYAPDFLLWLLDRDTPAMWKRYFGHGETFALGIEPDPATTPPELPDLKIFQECKEMGEIKKRLQQGYALNHPFLKKSIELFGADLQEGDDDRFQNIPFVLPLLKSSDFLASPSQEVTRWFEVFKLYIAESKPDRGVVLASILPIEPVIIETLEQLREDGIAFPER